MFLQKPMLGTQIDWSNPLNNPVLDLLFNEGHGDRVNDLSGYGNHGTLHGFDFPPIRTSGWNPGMDGVALAFDGDDDYIDCGNNPILNSTGAFWIRALIKTTQEDYGVIAGKFGDSGTGTGEGYTFSIFNTKIQCSVYSGSDGYKDLVGVVINDGKWHCVSGGYYNGHIYLRSDAYSTSTSWAYPPASTPGRCLIGNRDQKMDGFFKGSIARLRILPRAMSSFEVMQTQINPYGVYLQ